MDASAIYDTPELADGAYLLEAALAAGMNVDLFPRQVMICWHPDDPSTRTSFVHGVPQGSTLSGVTYAQDKRMVRALLQRAGVPSTKGATFSFRGKEAALRYADRVRYPVTVRMAIDDSIRTPGRVAANRAELGAAIDDLRRIREDSLASATNLRRSAYSLTGLLDPDEDEHGTKLLNRSTRVLIERIPVGPKQHVLVIDGAMVAAIEVSSDADGAPFSRDVTSTLADEHQDAAIAAAAVVPGLEVAHVILISRRANRLLRRGSYLVHDVSERLGLDVFEGAKRGSASAIASRFLTPEPSAEPLDREDVRRTTNVTVRFEGLTEIDRVAHSLHRIATPVDSDPVHGRLELQLGGTTSELSAVLATACTSGIDGSRAMLAQVVQAV